MINKVKAINDFIVSGGRAASIPVPEPLPEARITVRVSLISETGVEYLSLPI